jgi:hypothetical protein
LREPIEFSASSLVPALPVFQIEALESDELDDGELGDETEGLLDRLHGLGRGHGRGLEPATVVGTGRNNSDWLIKLVAGISKRLVLDQHRHRTRAAKKSQGISSHVSAHDSTVKEDQVKVSLKAIAIAAGVLWGGAILLLGVINLASPSFGLSFLQVISSVYPGFHVSRTIGDVLTGTAYALIDGAVAGLVFGWLYNLSLRQNRS